MEVQCVSFLIIQGCVAKTDLDGKMLSALLTGVNRAFPFIKGKSVAFHWCCSTTASRCSEVFITVSKETFHL